MMSNKTILYIKFVNNDLKYFMVDNFAHNNFQEILLYNIVVNQIFFKIKLRKTQQNLLEILKLNRIIYILTKRSII